MRKLVIYTIALGPDFGFVPQKSIEGVDFFAFTDDPKKVCKPWKPILVKDDIKDKERLRSRHPKLLPHLYFSDYDVSIYIDSNYLVIGDIKKLVSSLGDFQMGIFDHNQCDDARDCVYKEHLALLELGKQRGVYKDKPDVMEKQMQFFKSEGYPTENGLIFAAVLIRKHNDPQVIKVMEDWWGFVSTQSLRDQLSFNYVAWKNKFNYTIIPGDLRTGNPYFYFLASNRKNYLWRLLKYRIKHLLNYKLHP
ncbi:glycosyltransferase domain-containing protein [Zobellia laminariae]|uniref:glycosyltransferase domain-containing protein n=1 Tax=Zobellia laminariae TaxID=248906 RepID=UPI003EF4A8DD